LHKELGIWVQSNRKDKSKKEKRRGNNRLDEAGQPTLRGVEGVLRKERGITKPKPAARTVAGKPKEDHDYRTLLKHLAAKDITRQKEIRKCKQTINANN